MNEKQEICRTSWSKVKVGDHVRQGKEFWKVIKLERIRYKGSLEFLRVTFDGSQYLNPYEFTRTFDFFHLCVKLVNPATCRFIPCVDCPKNKH